jgi:RHS repeat-associated protein
MNSASVTSTGSPGTPASVWQIISGDGGASSINVTTSANGNITSIPPANSATSAHFAYNNANRLASVTGSPVAATFVYDWAGQRFSKTNNGSTPSVYSYSQGGTVIAENDGGATTDYIYADGRPIAILQPGATPAASQVNYVVADRLGTPQIVTNSADATVWSTTYQPFGTTGLIDASVMQNLRLPGQDFDAEIGFNYNINRDYMPNLGRYLETDPIGLAGGMNAYQYVRGNPFTYVDPTGLDPWWFAPVREIVNYFVVDPAADQTDKMLGQIAADTFWNKFGVPLFGNSPYSPVIAGTLACVGGLAGGSPTDCAEAAEQAAQQELNRRTAGKMCFPTNGPAAVCTPTDNMLCSYGYKTVHSMTGEAFR